MTALYVFYTGLALLMLALIMAVYGSLFKIQSTLEYLTDLLDGIFNLEGDDATQETS